MRWIIIFASVLHVSWGIALLTQGSQRSVPVQGMLEVSGGDPKVLAVILLTAGILGLLSAVEPVTLLKFALSWPQQFLLILSLLTACNAIAVGHYPDGTIRSKAFIFTDQLPLIAGAILHTLAQMSRLKDLIQRKNGNSIH